VIPRTKVMLLLSLVVLLVPVTLAAAKGRQDVRGGVAFVNGGEIDWIDPALDYISFGWQIEFVTCAQLVNYPDANAPSGSQLQPEVAKTIGLARCETQTQSRILCLVMKSSLKAGSSFRNCSTRLRAGSCPGALGTSR